MTKTKEKSQCCSAELKVEGKTTSYYICKKCGRPTDPEKQMTLSEKLLAEWEDQFGFYSDVLDDEAFYLPSMKAWIGDLLKAQEIVTRSEVAKEIADKSEAIEIENEAGIQQWMGFKKLRNWIYDTFIY